MKCPKCQHENPPDTTYCGKCAARLRGQENRGHVPGTCPPDPPRPNVTETIAPPREELTTGSTFAGRYQVIEELGHGGMGRVYKVLDAKTREKIALKLIKPEISTDADAIDTEWLCPEMVADPRFKDVLARMKLDL